MKIINKISNFFSKRTITASIRNKLMMDWSDENKFLDNLEVIELSKFKHLSQNE